MPPAKELQGRVLGRGRVWELRVPSPHEQPPGPTMGVEQAHVGGLGSVTALQGQTPCHGTQAQGPAGTSWQQAGEGHGQVQW